MVLHFTIHRNNKRSLGSSKRFRLGKEINYIYLAPICPSQWFISLCVQSRTVHNFVCMSMFVRVSVIVAMAVILVSFFDCASWKEELVCVCYVPINEKVLVNRMDIISCIYVFCKSFECFDQYKYSLF